MYADDIISRRSYQTLTDVGVHIYIHIYLVLPPNAVLCLYVFCELPCWRQTNARLALATNVTQTDPFKQQS